MPLGVVYVGVPVERELTLSTSLTLVNKVQVRATGGSSPAFTLVFEPRSGELEAKQVLRINIKYTALPLVLSTKCWDARSSVRPAARVRVESHLQECGLGLRVTREDQHHLQHYVTPTEVQLPDNVQLPIVPPLPSLDFGDDVPLFERRKMRIAVRNLSAIAASFNFACNKYPAEPLPPEPRVRE